MIAFVACQIVKIGAAAATEKVIHSWISSESGSCDMHAHTLMPTFCASLLRSFGKLLSRPVGFKTSMLKATGARHTKAAGSHDGRSKVEEAVCCKAAVLSFVLSWRRSARSEQHDAVQVRATADAGFEKHLPAAVC